MKLYKIRCILIMFCLSMAFVEPAAAHEQTGLGEGFVSGFLHPFLGIDHLIAMVAVGLWGAQLGNPAIWLLPITFPLVMAIGAVIGVLGVTLPVVELGIALSAVALGVLVAANLRPHLIIAALVVGFFAVFHGYAHGTELPQSANPLFYGAGFVIATGLLHLSGILIGVLIKWPMGAKVVRLCGCCIAILGAYYMVGHLGLMG